MKWKLYSVYKDSAVEWLGEIPEHWRIQKLKYVSSATFSNVDKHSTEGEKPVRLCNYTDVYNNDRIYPELNLMEATAKPAEIVKFKLRKGDVLITKDSEDWRDIAVSAYVDFDMDDVLCGYHLACIRPIASVADGQYLFRAFSSHGINDQFRVAATGITRYGLGKYWLDNSLFLVPPINEQRAIAAFLDRETERIDTLIAKKERQIELLQEKRIALVSHAVTKGLNPNAKMRDSGIEWLGAIPVHWSLVQLRRVVKQFVDYRGRTPRKVDHGVRLITAKNIKAGRIDFSLSEEYIQEDEYVEWMVRGWPGIGDVLLTTEAPLGEVAQITDTTIALAQRVIMIKINKSIMTNEYLKYHFISDFGQGELFSRSTGSTAIGIKADRLKETLITLPPLQEQKAITNFLAGEINTLQKPIEAIQNSIARLREYRTALISAAVTGRIDV
jgi:type I restriction enzyme S subunit